MWEAITIVAFSLINILSAKIDSGIILDGKRIYHALNGIVYLALISIAYLLFHNYWLVAVLLFDRLLFFNISLSFFRHLSWDYMPQKPKSIVDKISRIIFYNNGALMYLVYAIVFISLIVICFVW